MRSEVLKMLSGLCYEVRLSDSKVATSIDKFNARGLRLPLQAVAQQVLEAKLVQPDENVVDDVKVVEPVAAVEEGVGPSTHMPLTWKDLRPADWEVTNQIFDAREMLCRCHHHFLQSRYTNDLNCELLEYEYFFLVFEWA